MKQQVHRFSGSMERWGVAGVIAAKITCMVGMNLSLLLGLLGASGAALPVLDPVNRVLGPISLPLFLGSLALMTLGAIRHGPIALALVLGGGLLLYAAALTHDMNLTLYSVAMAMLIGPFAAPAVWTRLKQRRTREFKEDVTGAADA